MLQQNYYDESNRYLLWIKNNLKKVFLSYDLVLFIIAIGFILNSVVNNKNLLQKLVDDVEDEDIKMCDSWEKIAKQLMAALWKVRDAEIFHKPVDPVELNIPNYLEIIKKPMDFSTVRKKLNNNSYTNLKEYCEDMDLIFNNCLLYNGINSYVGEMCLRVKNEYKNLFEKFNLNKYL